MRALEMSHYKTLHKPTYTLLYYTAVSFSVTAIFFFSVIAGWIITQRRMFRDILQDVFTCQMSCQSSNRQCQSSEGYDTHSDEGSSPIEPYPFLIHKLTPS